MRVEPNLTALDSVEVADEKQQKIEDVAAESNFVQSTELEHAAITQQTEKMETVASTESATESVKALDVQTQPTTQTNDSAKAVVSQDKEDAFQFNANVETAEIKEFDEESSILDVHLNEQQKYDDESVLSTAETIIALNVYPNPRKALSGDKTLKMLLKYGLRFGELSCFHRYENPEEESHLLFSVLRVTDNGPDGFDLETLSTEQVQGLAFFLALPHSDVQKGFDTMVSIAGLIAREIDGTVYDENNLEFTPQLKEHWRHKAIDYRSGHDA